MASLAASATGAGGVGSATATSGSLGSASAGDLVVLTCGWYLGTFVSVSDSGGHTLTLIGSEVVPKSLHWLVPEINAADAQAYWQEQLARAAGRAAAPLRRRRGAGAALRAGRLPPPSGQLPAGARRWRPASRPGRGQRSGDAAAGPPDRVAGTLDAAGRALAPPGRTVPPHRGAGHAPARRHRSGRHGLSGSSEPNGQLSCRSP